MEPASAPGTFFVTDHYRGYPTVLVRLKKVPVGSRREQIGTRRGTGSRRDRS
jgi:hypothetical protein